MGLIVLIAGAGRPGRMENGGDRRLQDHGYFVLYFNESHMFSETRGFRRRRTLGSVQEIPTRFPA